MHQTQHLSILLLIIIFTLAASAELWQDRYPDPTSSNIYSGAYGDGMFQLVGQDGTVLQSTDGESWSACVSPGTGDYLMQKYTNGFYLISSNKETIYYSDQASCEINNWTVKKYNTSFTFTDLQIVPNPVPVGWSSGFVAVSNFRVYYSQSGQLNTFEEVTSVDYTQYRAWGVTYNSGTWLVKLGRGNQLGANIATDIFTISSTDGVTWSAPVQTNNLTSYMDYGLSVCNNQYISAFMQGIGVSDDGITWTIVSDVFYSLQNLQCSSSGRCVGTTMDQTKIIDINQCGSRIVAVTSVTMTTIRLSFPLQGQQTLSNGTVEDIFIVAGASGRIVVSNAFNSWKETGASNTEIYVFDKCTQVVAVNSTVMMNCEYSVAIYNNGTATWTSNGYSLTDEHSVPIQLNFLNYNTNQHDVIAAANINSLYASTNNAKTWEKQMQFVLHEHDQFVITNFKSMNNRWVVIGRDNWFTDDLNATTPYYEDAPVTGGTYVMVPIIALSDNLSSLQKWKVYVPNYWIIDMEYCESKEQYVGAGKSGMYISGNGYMWYRSSTVDQQCSTVVSNNDMIFFALCTNYNQTLVKVSMDGGSEWHSYQSPCTYAQVAGSDSDFECTDIVYIEPWNKFVVYSSSDAGMLIASTNGSYWEQIEWPYTVPFLDIVADQSLLFSLSSGVIFVGDVATVVEDLSVVGRVYWMNQSAPEQPPNFPVTGLVYVYPPSSSSSMESSDNSSDDTGLNGGDITGIIFGVMGFIVCVVIVLALVALGLIKYKVRFTHMEYEAIDENEAL